MSNEFDLELAKRGGVVLYSIHLGYGVGLHQELLSLVGGIFFKVARLGRYGESEKIYPPIESLITEKNFEKVPGVLSYASKSICESAGIEYIEPPVDVETLEKEVGYLKQERQAAWCRIDSLEQSIKNLHKVKGRYHTQQALESLFKLVGLENNIGEKNE